MVFAVRPVRVAVVTPAAVVAATVNVVAHVVELVETHTW